MVKPSPHLDLAPSKKPAMTVRARVPVTVESVDENGSMEVRAHGSDLPAVVTSGEPGLWAAGADAVGLADASGRIVRVLPPTVLPDGAETVAVGAAALKLQEHSERLAGIRGEWQSDVDTAKELAESKANQALNTARAELAESKVALNERIKEAAAAAERASANADFAYGQAQTTANALADVEFKAENALTSAAGASSQAAVAQGAASSAASKADQAQTAANAAADRAQKKVRVEPRAPGSSDTGANTGDVWIHRSGGALAAQYVWTGATWQRVHSAAGMIANNAVRHNHVHMSEELWAKIAVFAKVTTPMLIAGEARITENLLAEKITLTTSIIAGNEKGTHTKLDPHGLHIYRRATNGDIVEAVRLGVDGSEDYVGISDHNGKVVSSLDASGGAAFQSLSVAGAASMSGLILDGLDVGAALADKARAVSFLTSGLNQPALNGSRHASGQQVMIEEHHVSNPHDVPMMCLYVGSPLNIRVETKSDGREAWGTVDLSLRYLDKPLGIAHQPILTSPVLAELRATNQGSGFTTGSMIVPFLVPPRTTRGLLLTAKGYNTNWSIPNGTYSSAVIALGASVPEEQTPGRVVAWATDTGYGGYTPTPAPIQHVRVYHPTWGASYHVHSGARYGAYDSDGEVVHGNVPGAGAYSKAYIGFPDMMGDLSGANIQRVEVYLYFTHWYNGGGGTAGVGYHTALGQPSHVSGGARQTTITTKRAEGRWVDMPQHTWAALKNGQFRGILLMPDSTGYEQYARCRWRDARLRVTYTK